MNEPRFTKIVATIGPGSRSPEMLRKLITAGVNVARINCSHATAETIRSDMARIRRAATETGRNVAVLLDLQGPKIRTGTIEPALDIPTGEVLTVVMSKDFVAEGNKVGTTWPTMADDVASGERVLFADGALMGTVRGVRPASEAGPAEVDIEMTHGGELKSRKGINLPDTDIKAPALTEKDRADLITGVKAGADYVALSFVRHAQDIADLRQALEALGRRDLPVIAKIEKPQAVENLDEILARVEGLMVARGDLGVEIPFEEVPVAQKDMISKANKAGKLVITATQMLDSMERNPRPTRAEITDVANAIIDGTDAVMLSGETATGKYPVEAVETMVRIAREVESSAWLPRPELSDLPADTGAERTVLEAACYAVRAHPRPLVVFTESGSTAIKSSKSRPPMGIYAITHKREVADKLALVWGVDAVYMPAIHSTDDLISAGEQALIRERGVARGTEVVVLAGRVPQRGATNMMKVEVLDGRATL